jgi:hypothetical protein
MTCSAISSRSPLAPHQTMIWSRVRQVNSLRSMLREYYPAALAAFGADLAGREALAVLTVAPTPDRSAGSPRAGSKPCCGVPDDSATWRPLRPRSAPR